MTLLLTTTTVTVEAANTPEPHEGTTYTPRATGVAAHVSSPSGRERAGSDGGERIDAVLLCGTTVARNDRVTDAGTGDVYRVAWVQERTGLGLDHTKAGLVRATGAVAA
ncbi:MAG: hypothetical protein KA758_16030 [Acidimicrobiales bacterium]|nr:hypothetical protein [Acidimicrobiales bacterium]